MIRIGLLGASRIAEPAIIQPAREIEGVIVSAVAARDVQRAHEYASEHKIPVVCAGYEELVASGEVDLVYNALQPSEHLYWSVLALKLGKHVLCEKPFAMNAAEAQRMVQASTAAQRQLIEAFHYRFHPAFTHVLDRVRSGVVGHIRHVDALFNVHVRETPSEFRYDPSLGGGALMDLGCYPVHWARTLIGSEPVIQSASARVALADLDCAMSAELSFGNDTTASVSCDMSAAVAGEVENWVRVVGDLGTLRMENVLNPHIGCKVTLETDSATEEIEIAGKSTYYHQLQHVAQVVSGDCEPITGGADAIANMRVIDAMYTAAGLLPR